MKAIAIDNLSFSYFDLPPIINNLNLEICAGEKVGIIGPNGAGKTTLFLLICGILSPINGIIKLFNKQVNIGQFNPEIGLIFQNPNDQLFSATVRDDVAFGPENMGLEKAEIDRRVKIALSSTGVGHLIDRIPHQLSGGEKCMVAIASVIAMQPKIILYDEPSANLDLQARRRLIDFLQSEKETILVSSHDLELILEVCDRVILLDRTTIIANGIPSEIMSNKQLMQDHSLEVPYSLKS